MISTALQRKRRTRGKHNKRRIRVSLSHEKRESILDPTLCRPRHQLPVMKHPGSFFLPEVALPYAPDSHADLRPLQHCRRHRGLPYEA